MGIGEKYLAKKVSQEALAETLEGVGTKLPAQAFTRAFFWPGNVLFAKDVWVLAGRQHE